MIVISSAEPGDGKTTVVTHLAMALAEAHRKVLVIDADLRSPRMHRAFGISNDRGLRNLLDADAEPAISPLNRLVQTSPLFPGISIIAAGTDSGSISEVVHSSRMLNLVSLSRKQFDIVLIDTPPLLHLAEARIIGKMSDGVVLVFRYGQTTRQSAVNCCQKVSGDGIPLLGTILNDLPFKTLNYPYKAVTH